MAWEQCIIHWGVRLCPSSHVHTQKIIKIIEYGSCVNLNGLKLGQLLLFSQSLVMSDSLRPCGWQHTRLPCPPLSPGVWWNACPLSWWCHPTILSFIITFSSCLPLFSSIRVFSNELALHIRWPKFKHLSFHWIFRVDFL